MEITLTLNYGPMNAEFSGENREEVQEELIDFIGFIEEEKEVLSNLPSPEGNNESDDGGMQTPATEWEEDSDPNPAPDTGGAESVRSEYSSLATKTGVDEGVLDQLFELPDDEEGVPSLNMHHFEKGILRLGSARNQRQAQASSLLMYAWEECLDKKRIEYEKLDEALVASDVETERRNSMGQAFSDEASDWFESDGSRIYLVGKGKNHARGLIEELAEELD